MATQHSGLRTQDSALSPPHSDSVGHIVPLPVLFAVWIGLLIMTGVTVAVADVDLGRANLWVAVGIAVFKASLVALFFMHLKYDSPFHAVILIGALLFVMLFIGIAMMDSGQYQPEIQQWQSQQAPPT
ncbi:MAG TPA: cytochrome C oxidase subunit IV family protein [Phycisphaerae bacterium]|nr:cytochrome C oxidase subunit IV family protein [Phycisphaerae bacterium]